MGLSPAYVERTINRQSVKIFHGRAERQYGAADRRSRLCAADRSGRAERPSRRTAPDRADPPCLSRRTQGNLAHPAIGDCFSFCRKAISFSRTSHRRSQVWPGLRALTRAHSSILSSGKSVTCSFATRPSHSGLCCRISSSFLRTLSTATV